jgi:hypothetical protein
VRVAVSCRARRGCRGALKLRRGAATVARRVLRLRAGQRKRLRLRLAPTAVASRVGAPLKIIAPRGARAHISRPGRFR